MKMKSFKQFFDDQMKDREFREAWEDGLVEHELVMRMIEQRIYNGLTQAELAKRIGTKQSAISRFETGQCTPRIDFLAKLARALGARIVVEDIEPKRSKVVARPLPVQTHALRQKARVAQKV